MATVYIGIGSNVGDRQANIDKALAILNEHEEIEILQVSRVIETRPEGGPPQGDFLNAAAKVKTGLLPLEFLSQLKIVERRLGRQKSEDNDPRPIDLDILFYDDVVILEGKTLSIPHPRLAERLFVLEPLSEIAPEVIHPRLKKSVNQLYQERLHADHSAPQGA